jgi:hypothetical protein
MDIKNGLNPTMANCFKLSMSLVIILSFGLTHSAMAACKDSITASTPDSRFTVNGDEVTDHQTGLVWQHCTLGRTGSTCSGGTNETYTWQEALQEGDGTWRLPNVKELMSIMEDRCSSPAINATIFPYTRTFSPYWTSSGYARDASEAWFIHSGDGHSQSSSKTDDYNVRLVRDGGG